MLKISVKTAQKIELIDITGQIEKALSQFSIKDGFCLVYSMHTTAGIIVNENEPGLKKDIPNALGKILPEMKFYHQCNRQNAPAHVLTALTGQSRVIPIENGELKLGRWQSVFLLEMDGPRSRKATVQFFRAT